MLILNAGSLDPVELNFVAPLLESSTQSGTSRYPQTLIIEQISRQTFLGTGQIGWFTKAFTLIAFLNLGYSGAPYPYRKAKETHELTFSWLSWLAVLLVGAYARRRRRLRRRIIVPHSVQLGTRTPKIAEFVSAMLSVLVPSRAIKS